MPRSNRYYYTRTGVDGRQLIVVDPLTGMETVLVNKLPDGYFQFAPTEDYLLFTMTQEGPKERKEIYEVLEPDDRQPGWRNRSYLAKYDLKTGLLQPLTFGYHNVWAADISDDQSEPSDQASYYFILTISVGYADFTGGTADR